MGCCFSTPAAAAAARKDNYAGNSSVSEKYKATPPPPPPPPPLPPTAIVEEETVKEVLSETTTLSTNENRVEKKTQYPKPVAAKIREEDQVKPEILKVNPRKPGAPTLNPPDPVDPIYKTEDESEVSEICSLSVSESVSTITMSENKRDDAFEEEEDEEEARQMKPRPMRQRSPVKSKNRVVGHNPTRRTERSPGKKNVGGAGFGSGSVRLVQPGMGIGSRSGPGMRDPAERSGRRSRSPATNRSVTSPTVTTTSGVRRKNNQSPGRARLDPYPNPNPNPSPNHGRPEQQSKWASPSCSASANNYNGATNESFENPLVSLECFIFL